MADTNNDQVPMDQDTLPQQEPKEPVMRIYEDGEEPSAPMQDDEQPAKSKKSNGKGKAEAAAAAKSVTTLMKVDYESELITNMQQYSNLQLCDVTGKRFPKGGKIIQSCMAQITEAKYDKEGNVIMPEVRPHFVSEECHEAQDYIAAKGDCAACLKAALKFPGHVVCKAITHVIMLNTTCMRMNDLAYEQQEKYDEIKKEEQANAIAEEKARGVALRKEEVDKSRERKRARLAKEVADQAAKVEEAESALKSLQERAEPSPARIAHNGEEGDGAMEDDEPGHDDEVDQANQYKQDESKRLENLRQELEDFEANEDDEGDEEEEGGSSSDAPPPAKKSKKRERTAAEKEATQQKRAESLALKKREKLDREKETAEKVQNHDKLVEENKDLRDEYTSLHQKLLKTIETANLQTKDAQKLEIDMMTTINLQRYWISEKAGASDFDEMNDWIFKTQTKNKDLVKKINDEAAAQREAEAAEA